MDDGSAAGRAEGYMLSRRLVELATRQWPDPDWPVAVFAPDVRAVVGGVFAITLVPDGEVVSAEVRGWDRDLTDLLGQATARGDGVPDLVERAGRLVADLRARSGAGAVGAVPTVPTAPTASTADAAQRGERLSTSAALQARAERERGGHRPPDRVDLDQLAALMARRWPDAEISRTTVGDPGLQARPYGSSRVVFYVERHGEVGAAAGVGPLLVPRLAGRFLLTSGDRVAVTELIATVDAWLVRTMPPPEIVARPVLEP